MSDSFYQLLGSFGTESPREGGIALFLTSTPLQNLDFGEVLNKSRNIRKKGSRLKWGEREHVTHSYV